MKPPRRLLPPSAPQAEQNKQNLTRRAQEMDSSNQLLKDEIDQEKQKGALLETDLVNIENRPRSSLAQMGAQEKTACRDPVFPRVLKLWPQFSLLEAELWRG